MGFYVCKVGKDEVGVFYFQDLNDCGFDINFYYEIVGEGIMGKCLVFVIFDVDCIMNVFLGISGSLFVIEMDWFVLKQF